MSRLAPQTEPPKPSPIAVRAAGPLLQRKCSCGARSEDGETCPSCRRDQEKNVLRRSSLTNASGPESFAPPIVHEVLRSPGHALDESTRGHFESRFGRDFSAVRVHTGPQAAESARAVQAHAYAVGRDVVFGEGAYQPQTTEGRRILAHELTHVVQQGGESPDIQFLKVDRSPRGELEREADRVAGEIADHDLTPPRLSTPFSLQRQEKEKPFEDKSDAGPRSRAGTVLTEDDKKAIVKLTQAKAPTGSPHVFSLGPQLVLHDTAAKVSGKNAAERKKKEDASLERHRREERGPLDEAAAAYIPSTGGPAVIARPDFFDSRRPTATEFEKRADIIPSQATREQAFQKIWKAAKPAEQTAALDRALKSLELSTVPKETPDKTQQRAISERKLTPKEITDEKSHAADQLNNPLPNNSSPHIRTTASWAIGEICSRVSAAGAPAVAKTDPNATDPDHFAKDLAQGCTQLNSYLGAREARVGSIANVEIVLEKGSDCQTTPRKGKPLVPLPTPVYSDAQYNDIVSVYLLAALQAGRFPEISTHFWIDRTAGDHCDPRCFDLGDLYERIRKALGHPKGTTYGVKPSYGSKRGTNNVWWNDTVCGGPHP